MSRFFIEAKHATHSGGKGEYLHDWYPYLEGFSSAFVKEIIDKYNPNATCILEPFAGVGTVPIFCGFNNIKNYYCEINPMLRFIILVKSKVISLSKFDRIKLASKLNEIASKIDCYIESNPINNNLFDTYKRTFGSSVFFDENNFKKILKARNFLDELALRDEMLSNLLEIAILSCLLKASLLKRNGDVRFKTQKELSKGIPNLYSLIKEQVKIIVNDLIALPDIQKVYINLLNNNAKSLLKVSSIQADMIITSPPYLNGTNYFRNTKLELWFHGNLKSNTDLRYYRNQVVTSGINDVSKEKKTTALSIINELYLELKRNSYDTRIPEMVSSYFYEMRTVLMGLKHQAKSEAIICIDIGDSMYSNIYIPTHKILTLIANELNLYLEDEVLLRERKSKNGSKLGQFLLVFRNKINEK